MNEEINPVVVLAASVVVSGLLAAGIFICEKVKREANAKPDTAKAKRHEAIRERFGFGGRFPVSA